MFKVMMVCTGNICRSPMAEIVLRAKLAQAGLAGKVLVDSTGVSDEERGNPLDPRARRVLEAGGYDDPALFTHSARQVSTQMLADRDLVLAMTSRHAQVLRRLENSASGGSDPATGKGSDASKVRMFRAYDPAVDVASVGGDVLAESLLDVSDPWYGSYPDFETCLEQVEASVAGLVTYLKNGVV